MELSFRKATKVVKKARLGICGVSGSGKTLTSLKVASGLGRKIALIDTENNSSVLYADRIDFDVLNLEPPFEIQKYIAAIERAEELGYDVIILDGISHAWAGEGGILDSQGKLSDGGMNSFTAWRKLTPKHNEFIEAMIRSKSHIIATMRSKMDYIVETDSQGRAVPKKVGLAPIQREGMDYEFDIVLELDRAHNATSSKDRSSLFDERIVPKPGESVGRQILDWLNRESARPVMAPPPTPPAARPQTPLTRHLAPPLAGSAKRAPAVRPQLFDKQGAIAGEKETAAMLGAVSVATKPERLDEIAQSVMKGLKSNRLPLDQASKVESAIEAKRLVLPKSVPVAAA